MSDSFREGVIALIPQLRAYALSLTRSRVDADDLMQETLMRAWHAQASFTLGTNLKAWLYKILRNSRHTQWAKMRLLEQDVDGRRAAALVTGAEQEWRLEYNELLGALDDLTPSTRDAVLLIHGAGLSYEEAAQVCGCPVGTLKSRVNRGCERLAQLTDNAGRASKRPAEHALYA